MAGFIPLKTSSQPANNANLLQKESTLTIKGSSTLHDWDIEVSDYLVEWRIPGDWFSSADNWTEEDVERLEVTVDVNSMDGGRSKMNRDLREGLNVEEFPEIRFRWQSFAFRDIRDSSATAEISGVVDISARSQNVDFMSEITLLEHRKIVSEGVVALHMEDYGIDPLGHYWV